MLYEVYREWEPVGFAAVFVDHLLSIIDQFSNKLVYYNPSILNGEDKWVMIDSSVKLQNDDILVNIRTRKAHVIIQGKMWDWNKIHNNSFDLKRAIHNKEKMEETKFITTIQLQLLEALDHGLHQRQ
jgi:hypothetical protein